MTTLNRRALLRVVAGTAAGAIPAAALSAVPVIATLPFDTASGDADLLGKFARAQALIDALNAGAAKFGLDPEIDIPDCPIRSAWEDEYHGLLYDTAPMVATTFAGAHAKLAFLDRNDEIGLLDVSHVAGCDYSTLGECYVQDVARFLKHFADRGL